MKLNEIYLGDCLEVLRTFPDKSINTCVTSPPYWGLRDYGMPGQLGQEATPEEFVQIMVSVFREVKRIMKDDGTLWLNLGDSYAAANSGNNGYKDGRANRSERKAAGVPQGLKAKDLIGIPWAVAFALRLDGWYLRQDIIWSKPNPMPESVTDRCTKSHEYIFLLSKSPKYYYDHEAIKEAAAPASLERLSQNIQAQPGSKRVPGKTNGTMKAVGGETRNKRSIWEVATKPYKEAHFATYPPELITDCIKAGCPEGGIVLDPFFGSGTTGEVAERLNRKWVGIELNPEYKALAEKRLAQVFPLFKSTNAA